MYIEGEEHEHMLGGTHYNEENNEYHVGPLSDEDHYHPLQHLRPTLQQRNRQFLDSNPQYRADSPASPSSYGPHDEREINADLPPSPTHETPEKSSPAKKTDPVIVLNTRNKAIGRSPSFALKYGYEQYTARQGKSDESRTYDHDPESEKSMRSAISGMSALSTNISPVEHGATTSGVKGNAKKPYYPDYNTGSHEAPPARVVSMPYARYEAIEDNLRLSKQYIS